MSSATQALRPATRSFADRLPGFLVTLLILGLCALGILVLYSVGRAQAGREAYYVTKQAVWLCAGLVVFLIASRLDLFWLRRLIWVGCGIALAASILVLIPGVGILVNGARRWVSLGFMNLQVSELVKVALVFGMAHYLAENQRQIPEFRRGFIYPGLGIGAAFFLILLQPDYGTAALCALVGVVMLFLAGARLIYLVPSALAGGVLFAVAVFLDPVRFRRITAFMNVDANRQDSAYQLWQGMLAFGSGGVSGRGLGQGRQQMAFLPEAHTDFIFPIIGEELGLIATGAIAGAFLIIFLVVVVQMRRAPNMYLFLIAMGSLLFIIVQALINMGVATGSLPTKGMSLPYISYGGSNLVTMFFFSGLLINCFDEWNRKPGWGTRERSGDLR